MKRLVCTTILTACAVMAATSLQAQRTTQTSAGTGGSPHVKTEWTIDDTAAGATLRIEWGTVSATTPFTIG